MEYEFHVGDYVEDVTGRVGYINSICRCRYCEAHGFYEPHVIYTNGDRDYISVYEYKKGFPSYKRIGQYGFTKIEEIEPLIVKQYNDYCNNKLMWDKINELVEAVNKLKEKYESD